MENKEIKQWLIDIQLVLADGDENSIEEAKRMLDFVINEIKIDKNGNANQNKIRI